MLLKGLLQVGCVAAGLTLFYLVFYFAPPVADFRNAPQLVEGHISSELETPSSIEDLDHSDNSVPQWAGMGFQELNRNFDSLNLQESDLRAILKKMAQVESGAKESMPNWPRFSSQLRYKLFKRLGEMAPLEGMRLVKELYGDEKPHHYTLAVLEGWAMHDPEASLEWAVENPYNTLSALRGFSYGAEFQNWARGASQSQPSAVLELAKQFTDLELREKVLRGFMHGIQTSKDYQRGMQLLLEAEGEILSNYAGNMIALRWAQEDLEGAMTFVAKLPQDSALFIEGFDGVSKELVKENPGAAFEWASSFSESNKAAAFEIALTHWYKDKNADYREIADWVELNGAPSDEALTNIVQSWARNRQEDAFEVLDWIKSSDLFRGEADNAISKLADVSLRKDDVFVWMQLINTIENPNTRNANKTVAFDQLESKSKRYEGILESPQPDDVLIKAAKTSVFTDPISAMAYSDRIADADERAQLQTQMLEYWKSEDPEVYNKIRKAQAYK